MEKLHNRLQSCGVKEYRFVNDDDQLDQLAPSQNSPYNLQQLNGGDIISQGCTHVKTLIWKGVYLNNTTEINVDAGLKEENPTGPDECFYFATALKVADKVDIKKLRGFVKREWPKKDGGTLMVQLADTDQAEILTGFPSGSMPPGWHSFPLKLFIDDNILKGVEANYGDTNDMKSMTDRCSRVIISIGSGTENYSLQVSLLDMITSSIFLKDYVEVSGALGLSIEGSGCERYMCSFTREARNRRRKDIGCNRLGRQLSVQYGKMGIDETKPIKLTRKLFHITARKNGTAGEIRNMIDAIGDSLPAFMLVSDEGDNRHFDVNQKNALHYAAWKGDLETVKVLIDACKRFEEVIGDVVNIISTGEANYGKTPIFYAITQCRDDTVLYLCTHGANLLIVNNKGQTPCSLAVNKLKPSTCQLMFQLEKDQIDAGRKFNDFRSTHSDGRRYGDLDPRFLVPGDINLDDKARRELEQYNTFCSVEESKRQQILDTYPFFRYHLPDDSSPRSIKVTTPIWRQESWLKRQEEKLKLHETYDSNPSITCSNQSHMDNLLNLNGNNGIYQKIESCKMDSMVNNIVQLSDGTEIDMTLLPTMNIKNVPLSNLMGDQATYKLVDDNAGVEALNHAIDETLKRIKSEEYVKSDANVVGICFGLDCEWRPTRISGDESPVATLQLGCPSTSSFVIDVQSICQNNIKDATTALTPTEKFLSETVSKLLSRSEIPIIGFGIPQDLIKLAASFPHMPCFRHFSAVIDLQSLIRIVYPKTPKTFMSSLKKAVAVLLRKRIDKTEQCSEWNIRPLREAQLEYASLDATILPVLLNTIVRDNPVVRNYEGYFLQKQSSIYSSYRFTFLEKENGYRVAMGSIKDSFMQLRLARQVWPTFSKTNPPSPPVKIPSYEIPSESLSLIKLDTEKKKSPKQKMEPIELTLLSCDPQGLPQPGTYAGYKKESCITYVIKEESIKSLPVNSYLKFNRRCGVIEIGNAWLLFVNFGIRRSHHNYRNIFLNEGRRVTFTINPSRYEDSDLLQNLLIPDNSSKYRKSVLLFIRGTSKDKFMFCGDCKCISHAQNNDLLNLVLELKQYDKLKADVNGEAASYMTLVSYQVSYQNLQA